MLTLSQLLRRPAALVVVILFAAASQPVSAQFARRGGPLPKRAEKAMAKMARRTAELDRFERMTPDQRQKALDRLPPERRQRIERGLVEYRAMNPENRERLRNFERMPEERRDAVRQSFRRMQELQPQRRVAVRREVQKMRGMSEAERDLHLQSPDFRRRFDASEQSLLRDTLAVVPPMQE